MDLFHVSFKAVLVAMWIGCALIDIIRGPVKHQSWDDDGKVFVEKVSYACEAAALITVFWGLSQIFGCGR